MTQALPLFLRSTFTIKQKKIPLFKRGCSGLNPQLCWFYTRQVPLCALQNEAGISVINISIEDHSFLVLMPRRQLVFLEGVCHVLCIKNCLDTDTAMQKKKTKND